MGEKPLFHAAQQPGRSAGPAFLYSSLCYLLPFVSLCILLTSGHLFPDFPASFELGVRLGLSFVSCMKSPGRFGLPREGNPGIFYIFRRALVLHTCISACVHTHGCFGGVGRVKVGVREKKLILTWRARGRRGWGTRKKDKS